MMNRAAIFIIVTGILIAAAVFGVWYLQGSDQHFSGKPEPITIGAPFLMDSSGLVIIADDRHYFTDNGLDVTIKPYDSGLNAVDGLLNKRCDIAVATEFVMVSKVFQHENITGIGSLSRCQIHYLIGNKDHGITSVSDLRGKKIGYPNGTAGEFYLIRFLELNGIRMSDFIPVDVKPPQFVDSLANGTVDAILAWDPYVDVIKAQLGPDATVWPAQSGQQGHFLAICERDWASRHPELIDRFLKSIDQAATYMLYHPDQAKAILKSRLSASDESIATTWSGTQFSLSLDQSLITAMEDEGRWMINNNLTDWKAIPDYREYLYLDSLKKLKPGAVNII